MVKKKIRKYLQANYRLLIPAAVLLTIAGQFLPAEAVKPLMYLLTAVLFYVSWLMFKTKSEDEQKSFKPWIVLAVAICLAGLVWLIMDYVSV